MPSQSGDVKPTSLADELARLEDGNGLFRGLLESAPDAIVIVGRDGRIALVNRQTELQFGYRRTELLGQPVEVLVPERYRDRHVLHRDAYDVARRTRPMGAGLDLYARRKDGSEFAVEISLSPMQLDADVLVTAIVRDISERRSASRRRAPRPSAWRPSARRFSGRSLRA